LVVPVVVEMVLVVPLVQELLLQRIQEVAAAPELLLLLQVLALRG
jgi:hypothetical protein